MRRFKSLQIGSVQPYSGDLSGWYLKNNLAYGPVTAEVTSGTDVIGVSELASSNGEWSLLVTGLKAGRAIVTIIGTVPDSAEALPYSFLVEVKDKAKLRPGQSYQFADYR